MSQSELYPELLNESVKMGFPAAGGVDFDLVAEEFLEDYQKFDRWIEGGHHQAMGYLSRRTEVRRDPALLMKGAKSIFCVLAPYSPRAVHSHSGAKYARYLRGDDYHITLKGQLGEMMSTISHTPAGVGLEYKICVDTSALLERTWARLCGLGWIGKNKMLIHPKLGSYFFIGSVLLNTKLGIRPNLQENLCGHCQKCLDGCPTQALTPEDGLVSGRCISYATLEKREDWPEFFKEPENQKKIGSWIAGCDICQEVCPFNYKVEKYSDPIAVEDSNLQGNVELLALETEQEYKSRVKRSALNRVKYAQSIRNLEVVQANQKNEEHR